MWKRLRPPGRRGGEESGWQCENLQEAVDVLVASRSLMLATDVENDN